MKSVFAMSLNHKNVELREMTLHYHLIFWKTLKKQMACIRYTKADAQKKCNKVFCVVNSDLQHNYYIVHIYYLQNSKLTGFWGDFLKTVYNEYIL